MDKNRRSSGSSSLRSSVASSDSSLTDSMSGSVQKGFGNSRNGAPGISARGENREAEQAAHQAARQHRTEETRSHARNSLLNDVIKQSMELEATLTKDFGIKDPDTEQLGVPFQSGVEYVGACITDGVKKLHILLNSFGKYGFDAGSVQELKHTATAVAQYYQGAIDVLGESQKYLTVNRKDLEYKFVFGSPYAPSTLSAAIRSHTKTLTDLIVKLNSLPDAIAAIATPRKKASVPVLIRTAKVTAGLIQRNMAAPKRPASPAPALPVIPNKPVSGEAGLSNSQPAPQSSQTTFTHMAKLTQQVDESSRKIDDLFQEIEELFETEIANPLTSMSSSSYREDSGSERRTMALPPLPGQRKPVAAPAIAVTTATTTTSTTTATTTAKLVTTAPNTLSPQTPAAPGTARPGPGGVRGLPPVDAQSLKNAGPAMNMPRNLSGNNLQAPSQAPSRNPPQRPLPLTPGQVDKLEVSSI